VTKTNWHRSVAAWALLQCFEETQTSTHTDTFSPHNRHLTNRSRSVTGSD